MKHDPNLGGGRWPFLLAILVGGIGLTVMVGWWTGSPALVQLHPKFVPMQFNTALCFLLAAAALCAATRHWWLVARILGASVALIAAVTFAQYVVGRDFGIDQLLQHHYITTRTPYPGRMAHVTSISFFLTGLSTVLLTVRRAPPWPRIGAEALAALTVSISLVAIVGYASGIEHAYGWGSVTQMALHTALGILLVGFANLHFALNDGELHRSTVWRRTYVPLAIVTLATSLSLWQALKAHEERRIVASTDAARQAVEDVFALHADGRVRTLQRMAARWAIHDGTPRPEWQADARQHTADDFVLVGWMGPDQQLLWSETSAPAAQGPPGGNARLPQLARLCATAEEVQMPKIDAARRDGARAGELLVAVPLHARPGKDGCLVAVSALRQLYESPSLDQRRYGFSIGPVGGEQLLAASSERDPADLPAFRTGIRLVHGAPWAVSAWPTDEGVAELRSAVPIFILACGVAATVLLLAVLALYQVAARRADELALQHEQLRVAKAELERLALYDALTGIGNRNLFLKVFKATLGAAAEAGAPAALLIMDLNGFKDVNDQLGHRAGDMVLVTVASRIAHQVAERGQVFRMGGDEFAAVMNPGCDLGEALEVARSIVQRGAEPVELYGESRSIGISVGIAAFPRHGRDVDAMIRQADVAMYEAKKLGQPVVASLEMGATTILRLKQAERGGGVKKSG